MDAKPCPCGGTEIHAHSREEGDVGIAWAQCSCCGKRGPEVQMSVDDIYTLLKWDRAWTAWNERT